MNEIRIMQADGAAPRTHASYGDVHHHSLAVHYVAFRLEGGECVEYKVSRDEFHRLEEGAAGRLLVRGARYVRFERQ
ncbi:DUF2500 domain-containing protein [Paenibacillus thiaminolyticus]|uniref:DUF2500 family protein n=1 Tax=Paenibacillus thiaminolyticus TaxID=49283 RepID=UPI00232E8B9B|nr:DUF2500 family protein [Paenibacillus thiaminolyticus]WCF06520.1 DUF2500 domain-containing protein [Paenibacillus thiaminolyticus]